MCAREQSKEIGGRLTSLTSSWPSLARRDEATTMSPMTLRNARRRRCRNDCIYSGYIPNSTVSPPMWRETSPRTLTFFDNRVAANADICWQARCGRPPAAPRTGEQFTRLPIFCRYHGMCRAAVGNETRWTLSVDRDQRPLRGGIRSGTERRRSRT